MDSRTDAHRRAPEPGRAGRKGRLLPFLLLVAGLAAPGATGCAHTKGASDAPWFDPDGVPPARYRGQICTSRYLTMRDGVRIAADVYLPRGLEDGARIPAILHQTRYFRSVELRWPLRVLRGGRPFDHTGLYAARRKAFVTRGYAWIDVDVRGSGASFGTRICPWSPDEIRDGAEIVDWIVAQPWSNGRVGAMGISYDGTAAEFLLVNRHPAVRAVAPRFALFDAYTDIGFPGGVQAAWFTEHWGRMNASLDRNALPEVGGWWVRLVTTGVQPVDEDRHRSLRAEAVRGHADNYDVHAESGALTFRDDISPSDPILGGPGTAVPLAGHPADRSGSIGQFSPHNYAEDLSASGAAIYSYSGWLDGAYPHSAIKRFLTVRNPGSRLVLGPWNHGGGWNVDPSAGPRHSRFDHEAELLRFFDHHLKGIATGIEDEPPVHYYTLVEGKWKTAATWPPPGTTNLDYYLGADGRLVPHRPETPVGADTYAVNLAAQTGQGRWRNQVAVDAPVRYARRKAPDGTRLVYTSTPLARDMEVTGHPVVSLQVSSTATDGNLFVYLEDVDARGRSSYVTEGMLRMLHRKLDESEPPYAQAVPYRTFRRKDARPLVPGEPVELVFDLLPTSYLFRAGHAVRIALAGTDGDYFRRTPEDPHTLTVHRTAARPSRVTLPVMPNP